MAASFSLKTFQYFDLAEKNKMNKNWFEKNKSLYEDHVKEPFSIFIQQLDLRVGDQISRIELSPKKISRPLRAANKQGPGQGIIKTETHVSFAEKKISLYEWNPGIYIQIGQRPDDNFIGTGLYMVSSRQLKLMRSRIDQNYGEFHAILNHKKLKKVWGGLKGETYTRFPKEFDPSAPSAEYLWFKQFYLGRELSRKDVIHKDFFKHSIDDIELTIPFFSWIRNTVGTFKKNKFDF